MASFVGAPKPHGFDGWYDGPAAWFLPYQKLQRERPVTTPDYLLLEGDFSFLLSLFFMIRGQVVWGAGN